MDLTICSSLLSSAITRDVYNDFCDSDYVMPILACSGPQGCDPIHLLHWAWSRRRRFWHMVCSWPHTSLRRVDEWRPKQTTSPTPQTALKDKPSFSPQSPPGSDQAAKVSYDRDESAHTCLPLVQSKSLTSRKDITLWSAMCSTQDDVMEEMVSKRMQSLLGIPIRCQDTIELICTLSNFNLISAGVSREVGTLSLPNRTKRFLKWIWVTINNPSFILQDQ